METLKERFGGSTVDLVRMALQFALHRSEKAVVIPGFRNAAQVETNAAAAGRPLSDEDVAFIRRILAF